MRCGLRLALACGVLLAASQSALARHWASFCTRVDVQDGKGVRTHPFAGRGEEVWRNIRYELTGDSLRACRWPEGDPLWEHPGKARYPFLFITDHCVLHQTDTAIHALEHPSGRKLYEVPRTNHLGIWRDSCARDAGRLYLSARGAKDSLTVRAVDVKTGKTLWETDYSGFPTHARPDSALGICEPHSLAGPFIRFWDSPVLWVIDLESGQKRFDLPFPGHGSNWLNWFQCVGQVLVTATRSFGIDPGDQPRGRDILRGIDLGTGKLLWERNEPGRTSGVGCEVRGKLTLFSEKGQLRLLDPQTGRDEWPPLDTRGWPGWTAAGNEGDLYVKTNNELSRIDLRAPAIRWRVPAGNRSQHATPLLTPSKLLDARIDGSRQGERDTWRINLTTRDLQTGAVEKEVQIQEYAGFADSVSVRLDDFDGRFLNATTTFIVWE